MDRLSVGVFYFSAWSISTCLHQYHYVNELKTWTEAQSYCRRHYTDLATIEDSSEVTQLINSVSDGSVSEVWIGLFSKVDWRWSDGYTGNEPGYRNWCSEWLEPNFKAANEFCVHIETDGKWWDFPCDIGGYFICYTGILDSPFIYMEHKLTWTDAQRYCRTRHIDLATVKNPTENQMIQNLVSNRRWAWIGLFRHPNFYWSDGSSCSFSYWYKGINPFGALRLICAVASLEHSGRWSWLSCDNKRPFVCHGSPQTVKKQAVKLRMKVEDSSVDLNDPVVRADILKKLQDKLNMTLKWREGPDGKVFHKEKERPQKIRKKKTEL